MKDMLHPELILNRLGNSLFSTNLVFHESLVSTNTLAKELAVEGAPEGTLVLTEEQSRGRGRRGRQWLSPGYVNLLFSVVLRPVLEPDDAFVLTMILALAALWAVKNKTGVKAGIKWPNDIYVNRKKLAGILTELSLRHGKTDHVVLGLGLNVNWRPEQDKGLMNPATSIFLETGKQVCRDDLLVGILQVFERYYSQFLGGEIEHFYRQWNRHSVLLGHGVEIHSDDGIIEGKAVAIDRRGALILEEDAGTRTRIVSGDASVRF
jgi:BirA family biotin operon repressor/biotin-[acetyl-CoA-carboxylase] ligase